MKLIKIILLLFTVSIVHVQGHTAFWENAFRTPSDDVRVGTFWYWVSDNISCEGVVADLNAMKKAGINLAFIGFIGPSTHHNANYPYGKVKFMSEEWWNILHTALKTASDLDIEIGIFNSPGWSQSGGPWVKPEQSMRYLASTSIEVSGPRKIEEILPTASKDFQDVKVLAFKFDRNNLFDMLGSKVVTSDNIHSVSAEEGELLQLPLEESYLSLSLPTDTVAQAIMIYPGEFLDTHCTLQVEEDGTYKVIKEFSVNRDASLSYATGFDQKSPVVELFPEAKGKEFRLLFNKTKGKSEISSLILTSAPVIQRYPGKTFAKIEGKGKMPEMRIDTSLFVNPDEVFDLSECLAPDGTIHWNVPDGKWIILRMGMISTGAINSPASPEATGLETDKLSKKHITTHFEEFLGKIYKRIPAEDRKCWKYTVLDSYEKGGQNITDDMLESFKQCYGYDPVPFLPTYYGYPVGDMERSERFLWDMRRWVADKTAYEYVAGLREASHKYGLRTWLENYGHGGFSAEFLQYGGQSDEVSSEFWNDRHTAEKRAAASCAHIYNKPLVWAEAFTNEGRNGSAFKRYPGMLKRYGDLAFATGVNSMMLHVYIQQYDNDEYPGVDAWFGTEFNRKNTWFSQIDMFVKYLKRTSFMLQQGLSVADVAYYIGEDTPIMTGVMEPKLPKGYYFDFINSEVLINELEVVDGRLVLPHGISYRVLVLPPQKMMRPQVLQKLEKLVAGGATVIGIPPSCSPSLQDYPCCDKVVQGLAAKMWSLSLLAQKDGQKVIPYGKGRILMNMTLEEAFDLLKVLPDCRLGQNDPVLYAHRTLKDKMEIYFLTNQGNEAISICPQFRVKGMQPELWDAVTGNIRTLPEFEQKRETTIVPLRLEAGESTFIVFRKQSEQATDPNDGTASNFPEPRELLTVTTPWKVNFESDRIKRGPSEVVFDQLTDWTQNEDERIKFFSGNANYQTEVKLEKISVGKLYLDLGKVYAMAKVRINGKDVGGVWTAPYRVDITDAVQEGVNKIEVEVVNTWLNRILGDLRLSEKECRVIPHTVPWKTETPLQRSGLLGPVRILTINYY